TSEGTERAFRQGNSDLEVYPTVILQLTTLGLLVSLSSSAAAVLPAIPSLVVPTESAVTVETAPVVKSEDYYPITDSKNVEKFVRDYFAETPILAEIARCESTFRHYDKKTGQVLKGKVDSRDTGVMQINL